MKRCPNPNCRTAFLFGDDRTVCPFCRSELVSSAAGPQGEAAVAPDQIIIRDAERDEAAQRTVFLRGAPGSLECHGRVSEIEHHELFNSKRHKLANSLLRGEPYQLAHQTIEYTIRLESLSDGVPAEATDFCLYGNFLGRLQVGDEVVIHARERNHRRVVKSIYNETTNSLIKPGLQLPATFIQTMLVIGILAAVALICGIVFGIRTGLAAVYFKEFLILFLSSTVIIFFVVMFFAALWHERGR